MQGFKLLACGDIHLQTEALSRAYTLAQEAQVDLILLSGDFCDGNKLPPTASVNDFLEQAIPIVEIIAEFAIPTFFVLGNHDPNILASKICQYAHVTDLHGQKIQWKDYWFAGIGGSHFVVPQLANQTLPFLEGIFPSDEHFLPEIHHVRTVIINEISHYVHSNVYVKYRDLFPCDILLSHTPPLLPSKTNYKMASAGLYQLISQAPPLISISAHIHQPEVHIETLEWLEKNQPPTTLVNLGSLTQRKVGLITLFKQNKRVAVELLSL